MNTLFFFIAGYAFFGFLTVLGFLRSLPIFIQAKNELKTTGKIYEKEKKERGSTPNLFVQLVMIVGVFFSGGRMTT